MRYDARGKVVLANNRGSEYQNWYSGSGSLVGTDWRGLGTNVVRISEEFRLDPLGNVRLRRTSEGAGDRLRMFQTYDVRRTDHSNYENAGVW